MMRDEAVEKFDDVVEFPNSDAGAIFEQLVGLEHIKTRLVKEALLLLDPAQLQRWAETHHGSKSLPILDVFRARPPLYLFAGDVGTGKTALATSFGDAVARQSRKPVTLFSLSLTSRGTGAVGQMTTLISSAFTEVIDAASSGNRGVILLIDEADSLAQSRALAQMHHEDRAGVNTLIRRVDSIAAKRLPVMVVMCTNRAGQIDPAVKRRCAAVFEFDRPSEELRKELLENALGGLGLPAEAIEKLTAATGATAEQEFGFTCSDITQRLVPAIVLDAFPEHAVDVSRALAVVKSVAPTPPFREEQ